MTIPTIHTHCRHSDTGNAHEDTMSMCSDMLDKNTTNPYWTQSPAIRPNPLSPGLRLSKSLNSLIVKERKNRMLYIENLDPSTSINDLERAFSNHGPISNSTIRRKHYEATSHGILEFAEPTAKSRATIAHGTRIGSRRVVVTPKRPNYSTRGLDYGQGHEHGHGQGRENGRQDRELGAEAGPRRTSLRDITNARFLSRPY
ncbi:hypothetical protein MVEG_04436 [Podila verticillata NRRL 6337]|nr:hypothetical protein MVEG_04436 [Podila verticillata NRRL 6337]